MTRTNTLAQPDTQSPNRGLSLRPVAQRSLVASATFDSILSERRETAQPVERLDEPETASESKRETGVSDSDRDASGEQKEKPTKPEDGRPEVDRKPSEASEKGTNRPSEIAPKAESEPQTQTQSATNTPVAESEKIAATEQPVAQHGDKPRQPSRETEARSFITLHGKKAAKLRWDSAGVQLSHAADVSLSDKNAKELTSRAQPVRQEGSQSPLTQPAEEPTTLKTASRATNVPASQQTSTGTAVGWTNAPQAGGTDAQSQPSTVDSGASRAANPSVLTTAASQQGAGVQPDARPNGQRIAGDREALIARLATVGSSQAQSSKVNAGRVTAINAVSKAGTRAEATSKPGVLRQASPRDQSGVLRQVQQGLAKLLKADGGSTTLRLNPQSLGEVTVHLQLRHGTAEARLSATSDVARSLLQSGLKELKGALETRGLRVERLTVDPVPHRSSAEPAHEPRAESRESRASDGSQPDQRQDAENSPGGSRGSPEQHPGHGRTGHARSGDDSRSEETPGQELAGAVSTDAVESGWLRLDTVA